MRLFTILLALCQKVGAIDDYVIESGISGIWEYKKWHSGKRECTGHATAVSYGNGTTWVGGNYHLTEQIEFPSGLFQNAPRISAIEADAVLTMICGSVSTPQGVSFYVFNGQTAAGNVRLDITARGT